MTPMLGGRRYVVTGVTSGIGRAVAERLAVAGAEVLAVARSPEKLAALAAALPEPARAGLTTVTADLADPAAVARCVEQVRERGPLDGLVCNAAEIVYQTPLELPIDRWRRLLEVNVLANVALVQGLVPALVPGGHILTVSSVTADFVAHPRFAPYALTKTAIARLTDALRLELAGRGLKISSITPGLVDTEAYDKIEGGAFEPARRKLQEVIPKWLSAGDVADAVTWMLSRPDHVVIADLEILPVGQAR